MSPVFYELTSAEIEPFSAVSDLDLEDEDEQEIALGRRVVAEPLVFRQNSARRKPGDFVVGGSPALTLVSARFVEALRRGECTGWKTWPVELFDSAGQPVGRPCRSRRDRALRPD